MSKRRFPQTEKSRALVREILSETAKHAQTHEVRKTITANSRSGSSSNPNTTKRPR